MVKTTAKRMKQEFTVVIEQDEDGVYVGRVPELTGCHSQGQTVDELLANMREAVELCLEVEKEKQHKSTFVGVKRIEV